MNLGEKFLAACFGLHSSCTGKPGSNYPVNKASRDKAKPATGDLVKNKNGYK